MYADGVAMYADGVARNAQLVLRERQARDRRWWDRERDCFHPDATVQVTWFDGSAADFVAGSAEMAAGGTDTAHLLQPPIVHLGSERPDRAMVELGVTITSRTTVNRLEVDVASVGRILYRTERRAGEWRITSLTCVYARDTLTATTPGRVLRIPAEELAGYRTSYRMLSWTFARRGIPVRDDMLGDDRPVEVARFYDESFAWAGLRSPC